MSTITVTLPDELLNRYTRYAQALHISRAAYIRQSLERMNRETERQLRADRLTQASHKVREKVCASTGSLTPLRQTFMRKRGEIWLADLNPRRGTEPGKTRPVLIVQAQALLDAGHPSTLIIPLTTQRIDDAEPLRLRIAAQGKLRKTPICCWINSARSITND
jgi:mRNA-degrading endonuclease toxin of MazEF toxin-antitoxin module/predicted transcriptional regulator